MIKDVECNTLCAVGRRFGFVVVSQPSVVHQHVWHPTRIIGLIKFPGFYNTSACFGEAFHLIQRINYKAVVKRCLLCGAMHLYIHSKSKAYDGHRLANLLDGKEGKKEEKQTTLDGESSETN